MRVLEQVRVLDLSPYLPSQYCSFLLAQMGVEVVLVERPAQRLDAFPGLFELVNCGKKSIQLDLKVDLGREIFHRLAKSADVIIEGFRPGVASRLKIGYDDIKKIKPDIEVREIDIDLNSPEFADAIIDAFSEIIEPLLE